MRRILVSILVISLLLATSIASANAFVYKKINAEEAFGRQCIPFADVYVDDDAPPGWYDETHVRTIQEGINNVSSGGIVYVFNGIYYEQVSINKSVTLKGEDRDTTIITSGIISIEVDVVTVSGFTIEDTVEVYGGSEITISENKIIDENGDEKAFGIFMYSGSQNIITGNTITNIHGDDTAVGMYIANLSNSIIAGNTLKDINGVASFANGILGMELYFNNISGNLITDVNAPMFVYGIFMGGSNTTVTDNTIIDVYCDGNTYGLFLNGFNLTVASNTVTDISSASGGFVIGIPGSSYSVVEDNTITNITGYMWGIDLFESPNNTIKRNDIEGVALGIWLTDSHYNTIDNNSIRNCKLLQGWPYSGVGVYIMEATHNYITHNRFHDNFIDATFKFEHICNEDEPFKDYKSNRAIPGSFDRLEKDLSNTWCKNYWNQPRIFPVKITGILMVCNYDYTEYYTTMLNNYDYNPLLSLYSNPQRNSLSGQRNLLNNRLIHTEQNKK